MSWKPHPWQQVFLAQVEWLEAQEALVVTGKAKFRHLDDPDRMRAAIQSVLEQHPFFLLKWNGEQNVWDLGHAPNGALYFDSEEGKSSTIALDGQLWKAIWQIEEGIWALNLSIHHALADGWTFQVFWDLLRKAWEGNLGAQDFQIHWPSQIPADLPNFLKEFAPLPQSVGLSPKRRRRIFIPRQRWNSWLMELQAQDTDPNTRLLWAFQQLLPRLEKDLRQPLRIGLPLRNRPTAADKQSLVGRINFLPFLPPSGGEEKETKLMLRQVFRSASYPLWDLLSNSAAGSAFNCLFNYQKAEMQSSWAEGLQVEANFLAPTADENVLSLNWMDYSSQHFVELAVDFDPAVFREGAIRHYLKAYFRLAMGAEAPFQLGDAFLEEASAETDWWSAWNSPPTEAPLLFFEQEVWSERQCMDFVQQQAAHYYLDSAELIPLSMPRGPELVLSMLAAWYAGKGFEIIPQGQGQSKRREGQIPPLNAALPAPQFAYLARTSGSTGQPKLVRIPGQAIPQLAASWAKHYGNPNPIHLSTAFEGFDVFIGDVIRSLFSRQRLVLATSDERMSQGGIQRLFAAHSITNWESTPSVLSLFLDHLQEFRSLGHLIAGSENLSKSFAKKLWAAKPLGCRLWNSYGLTETGIDSLVFQLEEEFLEGDNETVPVGKPICGQSVSILSSDGMRLPRGLAGELAIGGRTVGEIDGQPSSETFATGDLAWMQADGNVVVVGRLDRAFLKVAGRRIPLQQIEHAALETPQTRYAQLLEIGNQAVLVSDTEMSLEAFEAAFWSNLGNVQGPDRIEIVDHWPLNANGKTDLAVLRKMLADQASTSPWQPSTQQGEVLALVVKKLQLPWPQIGLPFSRLGWSSLQMMRLVHEMGQMGQEITIRSLVSARDAGDWEENSLQISKNETPMSLSEELMDDILSILNADGED